MISLDTQTMQTTLFLFFNYCRLLFIYFTWNSSQGLMGWQSNKSQTDNFRLTNHYGLRTPSSLSLIQTSIFTFPVLLFVDIVCPPFLVEVCASESSVRRWIDKPSVAYWDRTIAALPLRLPPTPSLCRFPSSHCICLILTFCCVNIDIPSTRSLWIVEQVMN